jgi:ATP-dependent DNA helicase RecQ
VSEPSCHPTPTDPRVTAALQRWFGFDTLRPLQSEAIAAALDRRDALVVLPTGGGKSLCYQLPPLIHGRLTLVVSPLIALMQDQVDGLRVAGYPAAALHSAATPADRARTREAIADGSLRLLFLSPERLFTGDTVEWIAGLDVGAIAIDEAHCISQWGHDFRPEYRRLREIRRHLPEVPFHAYTATATPRVRADIIDQLGLRDPRVLIGTFDRPNLTYRVHPRVDRDRQVADAVARHPDAASIVYCIARADTEKVAEALRERGISARAYHAGLDNEERTKISEDFRAERLPVVVATVAFGMGIDRGDVRLVVHAAMPKSIEHYQQETGRAGRDGLEAECLLLYSGGDAAKWRSLMERNAAEFGASDDSLRAQIELLAHMHRFASGARCRHRALSEYFGQDYGDGNCGACDVCLGEYLPVADSHVTAQKILSAVARTGERFGAKHVIDVLRGSRGERIIERGHDKLSTFGLLSAMDGRTIGNFIDQLVDAGDLGRTEGEYPTLFLTSGSRELLSSRREAVLVQPKVNMTRAATRSRTSTARVAARGSDATDRPLDNTEEALFQALRALRRDIARELSLPPYMVFSDVTLEDMARRRPATLSEMLAVKGVGQKKLDSFGQRFLELLNGRGASG